MREGDAHLLATVAAVLEAVRKPAGVAGIDRDAPVVAKLVGIAALPLEQQAIDLDDPVDALRVGRRWPTIACQPPQKRIDLAIPTGRQFGDQSLYTRDESFLGQRRLTAAVYRSFASG